MKQGLAGVAVAAVMGACALAGGVERAKAATYEIAGAGNYVGDNNFTFDLVYDPLNRHQSTITFDYFDVNGRRQGGFTDTMADVSIKETYRTPNSVIYYSFDVQNTRFSYDFKYYDFVRDTLTPVQRVGYSLSANLQYDIGSERVDVNGYNDSPFQGPGFSYFAQPLDATGPLVTTVPLPAGLPMFGAGLLALGGVAFARRRGSIIARERLGS